MRAAVLLLLLLGACKPKPDPVCQAARTKLAACASDAASRDKWDQDRVDQCVHDIRKASNAQVLEACTQLASCDEARTCINTTLTAAARK